ncbi:HNH endonuclease [Lacunisphaera limnophila]|uniref:HNH endonuclease n=1 Tax=Lacunisphaera limnophila TaxID=1838286 RepID=UPI00147169B7
MARFPAWVFGGGPTISTASDHAQSGWPSIFKRDRYQCIYCSRGFSHDLHELLGSTTDHIVPQSLFGNPREANHPNNLAASCAVCNNLKGNYRPPEGDPAWSTRGSLVQKAREHIAAARARKLIVYRRHLADADMKPTPDCHAMESVSSDDN